MGDLPFLVVDPGAGTAPYEQVRRQLADLVGSGALAPGDRLPPIRQLAGDLGLAAGTVARAYSELEAAGLVRSRRGGGTRVADAPPVLPADLRDARLREQARGYVQRVRLLGVDDQRVLDAVRTALEG